MNKLKQIGRETQVKFHQFMYDYEEYFKKPEYKFLSDITFGILQSKHIHLAKSARCLREYITPKKTEERLSYHIGKEDISERISESHVKRFGKKLKNYKYIIYDGSDIVKAEAEKMEGLSKVRDGSKSGNKLVLGNGYHWDNLIAVSESGEKILPMCSEVYSIKMDKDREVSENKKIIKMVESINEYTSSENILVIDRGGDRRVLIKKFLDIEQSFIIRQDGTRYLNYNGENLPLKEISRKVKLKFEYNIIRMRKNKKVTHQFKGGAVQVYFPTADLKDKIDNPLWLVVVKEKRKGYSWFLCNLPTCNFKKSVDTTIQGYANRWKIEEFHRQIKHDYKLESIKYQRYEAIRTIGALLAVVMGFISKISGLFFYNLLILTRLLPKNKLNDLPKYIYYRLTEAVKIALGNSTKINKNKTIKIMQMSFIL